LVLEDDIRGCPSHTAKRKKRGAGPTVSGKEAEVGEESGP